MPDPDCVIQTRGLTKVFRGGVTALDKLDLDVRRGEIYGFIGPNGAGKSTTIRLLLDLLRPTAGSASVLGSDVRSGGTALRARLGYLPGELHLDERLTARQTLQFHATLRGVTDSGPGERLADRFRLPLDRPVGELSKGNKQKVGLVLAFFHDPELVILDEPTSGLDPILQQVFHELVEECHDRGVTVFLSSHVLSELEHTAGRVAMIREGRLLAVRSVEDLKRDAPHRVIIRFGDPVPPDLFDAVPEVSEVQFDGPVVRFVLRGSMAAAMRVAAQHEVVHLTSTEPDLEEIFLSLYDAADERDEHA